MKILFTGFIPPQYLQDKLKEWGSRPDFAGHAFQSALISGLDQVCGDVSIITSLWIPTYPKVSKVRLSRELFSHKGEDTKRDVFIGFVNLPFIKRISVAWRFFKEIWRATMKDKDMVLVNYALSSASLIPICLLRKRFKTVCQIVPDLPEFMSAKKNKSYLLGKAIDIRFIHLCLRKVDRFVLLSPFMRDLLPIGSKPWMQLEGVYNPSERVFSTVEAPQGKKVVMYSGALGLRYGLGDLVEAFSRIKGKEYELWLCGAGNARKMITDYAKKDDRIHYLGVLARNEVLALQKQATVLVNPRHKTEEYTKYSFPSKTMEFLASGTPVIMSHLDSIPDEYDDYIFYFDDESVEGMKNLIESVCEKPWEELREFGLKASEFILSQKTSTIQAKRLYDFLSMS